MSAPAPSAPPASKPVKLLRYANRKLLRPWVTEAKRVLVWTAGVPQTFVADRLGEFRYRCQTKTEVGRTADYGYEMGSLAAFLFLLGPQDVVWDIGASVGLFTTHCAKKAAKVVAFEPDPPTFARLKENVALNGLDAKVVFENCALGAENGELELFSDGLEGFAPAAARLGRHSRSFKVPVKTVDGLVAAGLPAPTAVKIDIEGAEILALRGAVRTLNGAEAPRLLFLEVHPQFLPAFGATAEDVLKIIQAAGYVMVGAQMRAEQNHVVAVKARP